MAPTACNGVGTPSVSTTCCSEVALDLIDADSLILQSIASLCARGVPEDKTPYFHEKARPLIGYMVEHLMEHMPAKPEMSLLLWLMGRVQMPSELSAVVGKWVDTGIVEGLGFEDSPRRQTNPSKPAKLKSALKEISLITPNGTHVYDEEERLRNSIPPLSEKERCQLIKEAPIFANLSETEIKGIAKACEMVLHLDGEEVLKNGVAGQGMHVVVKGEGKVLVSTEVGVVTTGDTFGDSAMLQAIPSTECVEAHGGPLTTLHLPSLTFRALGLKKKIGNMLRKRALKARDASLQHERRNSCQGNVIRATSEEDMGMVKDAIIRNDNLKEVLHLTEAQVDHVVREAYVTHFSAGSTVFEQGTFGHRFYIVIDGIFEVSDAQVRSDKLNQGVMKLRTGDSFGELALLYNAPRAATVTCKKTGSCWVIARSSFKSCMWMKMEGRIAEYAELIRSVDIFQDKAASDSLANLCNALEERYFICGETIVEQGALADSFFVIFEGTVSVIKNGEEVRQLGRGHYFGERALLMQDVRSATVKVASDRCTVLALDRVAFNVMLQTCGNINYNSESEPAASGKLKVASLGSDASLKCGDSSPAANAVIKGAGVSTPSQDSAKLIAILGNQDTEEDDIAKRYIPRQRLQRVGFLGQGSFGYVSLERDKESGRLYALKAMSKAQIEKDQLTEAVVNEKTCLGLVNSSFVVKLVSTYRDSRHVHLLLEPCFGGELFEVFEKNSDFFGNEVQVQFYAACVALGLEHMHDRRIIYRDLKLENCLLTLTGYLKLTDLGIAKVCIGKTYTVCGTADYFAPETLRQTGHNRAVDWWALGVLIYIMMTGRSPFDAPDTMKIYRKIMKGFAKVTFPSDFPEQCISMIRALCQKNPEERLTMGNLGVQNFKDHPWYRFFHWKDLQTLKMVAPYIPSKTEEEIAKSIAEKCEPVPPEELNDANGDDEAGLSPVRVNLVKSIDGLADEPGWDDVFAMSLTREETLEEKETPAGFGL